MAASVRNASRAARSDGHSSGVKMRRVRASVSSTSRSAPIDRQVAVRRPLPASATGSGSPLTVAPGGSVMRSRNVTSFEQPIRTG